MIRDIRNLDEDIKQEYGLILADLFNSLKDKDVFQMKAFYEVLAYIQIPKKHRRKIMDFFLKNETIENSIDGSLDSLLSKVKGQERDILRFTLMQDIISVTMANLYVSEDKKERLEKIQRLLQITDEQMNIFEGELEKNGELNPRESKPDKILLLKRNISKYLAVGVPIALLFYSSHNAYNHSFKSFALLQLDKKINPRKSYYSLGKYLMFAGILYKGITWGASQKIKNQNKLEKMLKEESVELINRSKKYMEEDLAYYEKSLRKIDLNDSQIEFKILMEKAIIQ